MNEGSNKRIAKNTLFLYLRMGIVMLITLYTSRVFLRTLGVEDFGIYNVVAGFVSMFTFLNSTMATSIQRFFNFEIGKKTEGGVRKVYSAAIITQMFLAIIIIVLIESVGVWYIQNKMVIPEARYDAAFTVFQLSVVSILLVIMTVPYTGAILAYEKMGFYAYIGIIEVVLKLIIALILPFVAYDKLVAYAALLLGVTFISFLLNFIYAKNYLTECVFNKNIDKSLLKGMIGFSGWHAFAAAGTMLGNQGINMILNLFYGPAVNAARGVAYQVNSAVMGFVRNISVASKPQTIQSYAEGNINRTLNITYSISKISYLACLLFLLPICINVDYILALWLGADTVPKFTNVFVIWVLITSLLCTLDTPITTLVHATGKIRNYHLVSTVITLLTLPIGYFSLSNSTSPVIIFEIQFVAVCLGQIIGLFLLKQVFPFSIVDYLKKVILPIVVATVSAVFIALLTHMVFHDNFIGFAMSTVLSFLGVVFCSYLVALTPKERDMVNEFIFKIIRKK